MKKSYLYLLIFFVILSIIFYFYPEKFMPSLKSTSDSLFQFLTILPAIVLLMGIFTVIVTPDVVTKNFGKDTGISGYFKALALGSLMSTGPFYLSFPMAKNLLDKGARIPDVIIFVSAWNGIGIIAEIVELHFMGPLFMFTRLLATSTLIILIGPITEVIYKFTPLKKPN